MSENFAEHKLEKISIELLPQEGYPHTFGNTIIRKEDGVLIQDDLRNYLKERCARVGRITIGWSTLTNSSFLLLTY